MRRRDSLAALLALGAFALPCRARSRPLKRTRPYRIGVVPNLSGERYGHVHAAFRELGWAQGTDYVLIRPEGQQGVDVVGTTRRIVDSRPDLILSAITSYAVAAQRLTSAIPIVMWTSGFPVEAGVADSLARPGRNATGLSVYAETRIFGKLLQLLHEAAPRSKRVGVVWTYVPPLHPAAEIEPGLRELMDAARQLSLDLRIEEVETAAQTHAALAAMDVFGVQALLLTSAAPRHPHRHDVMRHAVARRLPTICDFDWSGVDPHPLFRYSPSPAALLRQAAAYVWRILEQGAQPGDLPIQQPSRFDLEVHLRTAREMGFEVPRSILLRADRVIE